jgi:RNA polymerase sigma-70 factor (ECF subfamily)
MCYDTELQDAQPRLISFVNYRINNKSDALDVIQETNLVLIRKKEQYDSSKPFIPWVIGIAKYQIMAYFTKLKRDILIYGSNGLDPHLANQETAFHSTPFCRIIRKERLDAVRKIGYHSLSKQQLVVFTELLQGSKNPEISATTGISTKSVQVLKCRLIKRLKNLFEMPKEEALHLSCNDYLELQERVGFAPND